MKPLFRLIFPSLLLLFSGLSSSVRAEFVLDFEFRAARWNEPVIGVAVVDSAGNQIGLSDLDGNSRLAPMKDTDCGTPLRIVAFGYKPCTIYVPWYKDQPGVQVRKNITVYLEEDFYFAGREHLNFNPSRLRWLPKRKMLDQSFRVLRTTSTDTSSFQLMLVDSAGKQIERLAPDVQGNYHLAFPEKHLAGYFVKVFGKRGEIAFVSVFELIFLRNARLVIPTAREIQPPGWTYVKYPVIPPPPPGQIYPPEPVNLVELFTYSAQQMSLFHGTDSLYPFLKAHFKGLKIPQRTTWVIFVVVNQQGNIRLINPVYSTGEAPSQEGLQALNAELHFQPALENGRPRVDWGYLIIDTQRVKKGKQPSAAR